MPSVLTIGNFDGVHVGHQAIVRACRALAEPEGLPVVAMTFDPHPIARLRPTQEPPRLATLPERITALKQAGADEVVVIEPDDAFLDQSAEAFIQSVVRDHAPVSVIEGETFRFGKNRTGDHALLARLGQEHGFEAQVHPRVEATLTDLSVAPVSSSLVRWLINLGRVRDAAACLGRPFQLTAPVAQGEQRGRTIGFPTANLDPATLTGYLIPGEGVYAGTGVLPDGTAHPAAISIGVKPTFGQRALAVEAHLLGLPPDADLYGQPLTLHFERWLRGQVAFPSPQHLVDQLQRDLAAVREAPEVGLTGSIGSGSV